MRSAPTDAERRLWTILRAKRLAGYKFKRQHPIGSAIVDFVSIRHRLVIEADGGQHASVVDEPRDAFLRAQGYRILRFWNNDILNNEEGVAQTILSALNTLSHVAALSSVWETERRRHPLPSGEGLERESHA